LFQVLSVRTKFSSALRRSERVEKATMLLMEKGQGCRRGQKGARHVRGGVHERLDGSGVLCALQDRESTGESGLENVLLGAGLQEKVISAVDGKSKEENVP
jgi:hypothetical protein